MRTLIIIVAGSALIVAVLMAGWALEDRGVHFPGEGTPRGPISSPTAAYPR